MRLKKTEFTMARLIEANPCNDGLDRLTNNIGEFTGTTVLDLASSQFDECTDSDVIWCLRVLDAPEDLRHLAKSFTAHIVTTITCLRSTNPKLGYTVSQAVRSAEEIASRKPTSLKRIATDTIWCAYYARWAFWHAGVEPISYRECLQDLLHEL